MDGSNIHHAKIPFNACADYETGGIYFNSMRWPEKFRQNIEYISFMLIHESLHLVIREVTSNKLKINDIHWPFDRGMDDTAGYKFKPFPLLNRHRLCKLFNGFSVCYGMDPSWFE